MNSFQISQRGVKTLVRRMLYIGTVGPVGTNPVNYLYPACLLQEVPMFIFSIVSQDSV